MPTMLILFNSSRIGIKKDAEMEGEPGEELLKRKLIEEDQDPAAAYMKRYKRRFDVDYSPFRDF